MIIFLGEGKCMIKVNDPEMMDRYILKYGISEIFTEDIKPYMELLLFKKNEYICREAEELKYLFFFIEGKAKVYTTLSNGKSLLLSFYQGFRVIGDLEMINRQSANNNVQVIEDTFCIGVPLEKVRACLLNDAKFLRYICNSLSEKLSSCAKNSSINLLYPLENRLASYILATGEDLDGSLTEISELLGTSYRHLLRTLNSLCSKGIIKKKGNGFEILDRAVLLKLAADLYL